MNNAFSLILKYLLPFTGWFLGVYIVLFVMCFYVHVNESNIIANRADALLVEIAHGGKSSLAKVSFVQNMVRKTKPSFLEPSSIVNSLFGKREPFKVINKILVNSIENHKAKLAGLSLDHVDLEGADLGKADMHGANLKKANLSGANLEGTNLKKASLSGANLEGANLIAANLSFANLNNVNLNKANLSKANLKRADLSYASFDEANLIAANLTSADLGFVNLSKANLSKANLRGANLSYASFDEANLAGADLRGATFNRAMGITCDQIESAVIDGETRLPDYITLTGSLGATYKCENTLKKN